MVVKVCFVMHHSLFLPLKLTGTSWGHSTPLSRTEARPLVVSLEDECRVTHVVGLVSYSVAGGGDTAVLWVIQARAGDSCRRRE